jgi:hypothetical protein
MMVADTDGQVHKVHDGGAGGEFPFKASKFIIHILLEGFPAPGIFCRVGAGEPNSQAIVNNEAAPEEDLV